jgi:hypothetical protein
VRATCITRLHRQSPVRWRRGSKWRRISPAGLDAVESIDGRNTADRGRSTADVRPGRRLEPGDSRATVRGQLQHAARTAKARPPTPSGTPRRRASRRKEAPSSNGRLAPSPPTQGRLSSIAQWRSMSATQLSSGPKPVTRMRESGHFLATTAHFAYGRWGIGISNRGARRSARRHGSGRHRSRDRMQIRACAAASEE